MNSILCFFLLQLSHCSIEPEPLSVQGADVQSSQTRQSLASGEGVRADEKVEGTKPPSVHRSFLPGSWYPEDPGELRELLQGFFEKTRTPPSIRSDQVVALIVPHAGYRYSGQTAAACYRILAERKPGRIILIGPSHSHPFRGVCVSPSEFFETPLGRVPVDADGARSLLGCPLVHADERSHRHEHSVDIQLPMLQFALKDSPFEILPLLVGTLEPEDYPTLAAFLRELLDDTTVLVISSDFTHYGPRYGYVPFERDKAVAQRLRDLDEGAWNAILQLDRHLFLAYQKKTGITICGSQAIALLLEILPRDTRGCLVSYTTSAQETGDFENTVSYACLAFLQGARSGSVPDTPEARKHEAMKENRQPSDENVEGGSSLLPSEKSTLLRLARDTLESYVRQGKTPDPLSGRYELTPNLREPRGAFVTLKKHGTLRGCIGYIQPLEALFATVQDNTTHAASRDTRFPAVQADELSSIEIEISALSQPRPVASYKEIVLGVHGIILKKGSHQAVFLPQVAPEQGWDLPETLRHLSLKAGLSGDAWRLPDATFSVFTAEVF